MLLADDVAKAVELVTGVQSSACPYCGGPAEVEIYDMWDPRQFQLNACCERLHDAAVELLDVGGKEAAELMRLLGAEVIGGNKIRRVVDDGCGTLVVDWALELCAVEQSVAKAFVRRHHDHRAPGREEHTAPVGWKFGRGVRNGRQLVGVLMAGRPVARMIDHTTTLEINRLCLRRDIPRALCWNAVSMLSGYAFKRARQLGYAQVLTYTLASEDGASLRAAGWEVDGLSPGGSWNTRSRARVDKGPTEPKVRWKKRLRREPWEQRSLLLAA
jgi:hypothetical protein